jgi:hypothetical protein
VNKQARWRKSAQLVPTGEVPREVVPQRAAPGEVPEAGWRAATMTRCPNAHTPTPQPITAGIRKTYKTHIEHEKNMVGLVRETTGRDCCCRCCGKREGFFGGVMMFSNKKTHPNSQKSEFARCCVLLRKKNFGTRFEKSCAEPEIPRVVAAQVCKT